MCVCVVLQVYMAWYECVVLVVCMCVIWMMRVWCVCCICMHSVCVVLCVYMVWYVWVVCIYGNGVCVRYVCGISGVYVCHVWYVCGV